MSPAGLRLLIIGLILTIAVGLGFGSGVWWGSKTVTKLEKDLSAMEESRNACQATIAAVAEQAVERAKRAATALETAKKGRVQVKAEETHIRAVNPGEDACQAALVLHRSALEQERAK